MSTDGALAVLGRNAGLVQLLKSIPELLPIHYIIHTEYLISKILEI
jgi:hypothetical protein